MLSMAISWCAFSLSFWDSKLISHRPLHIYCSQRFGHSDIITSSGISAQEGLNDRNVVSHIIASCSYRRCADVDIRLWTMAYIQRPRSNWYVPKSAIWWVCLSDGLVVVYMQSVGASDDAVSCAVMLEVLHSLANLSNPLRHGVVFLFNGAEENVLQVGVWA